MFKLSEKHIDNILNLKNGELKAFLWVLGNLGKEDYVAISGSSLRKKLSISRMQLYRLLDFFRSSDYIRIQNIKLDCRSILILIPNPKIGWRGVQNLGKNCLYNKGWKDKLCNLKVMDCC